MIGRAVSHYTIIEKLGEGGMGVVYKARDLHLDRFAALKVLPPERMADPDRKRRFVQEAKAASALNHPHIITIYDIDQADGIDFIAMEYVAGKTLDQLLPRKGLRLNEALKYAIQVADALSAAHAAGIVHRDLKPGNVMVSDAEGHPVKVLDFGLAKLAEVSESGESAATRTIDRGDERTEEGVIMGTVSYMSPEQAQGQRVDARSDIFSFGALLYEMATGRRAFRGDSRMSTLAAIINQEPRPIAELAEDVPRDLEKIIARCLRKDPERRPQHMVDVRLALEELKEESESGLGKAAVAPARVRRRIWLPAVVALAIAAAALFVYSRASRGNLPEPKVVPLTTYAGAQIEPALSPDGKQVAFSWDGEKEDNFDIYVKLVDAGTPLRLTTNPAPEHFPAWSPDGRFLAFLRLGEQPGFYMIPALGGPERKLADLPRIPSHVPLPTCDWFPDGKALVMVDTSLQPAGLSVLSLQDGARRPLLAPAAKSLGDYLPRVSPDGKALAFARYSGSVVGEVYLVSLSPDHMPAGKERRITFDGTNVAGLAWTSDGRDLVFGSQREGRRTLWRLPGAAGPPQALPAVGLDLAAPSTSRESHRLAYEYSYSDTDVCRVAIPARGGSQVEIPSERLISSTRIDRQAEYSPDGSRIVFSSDRSGVMEVWVANADGTSAVQLTSFGRGQCLAPRWSPDGKQIACACRPEGNVDIYVVDAQGGTPRRLTNSPATDATARWSRDGRWIYFASDRSGRFEIWKKPADGTGNAVQVTTQGGWVGHESTDGAVLYYTKFDLPGFWKMPAAGGPEVRLMEYSPVSLWEVTKDGVYFLRRPQLQFLDFRTNQIRDVSRIQNLSTDPTDGLSVSPDGRWVLYTSLSRSIRNLMLVENFR